MEKIYGGESDADAIAAMVERYPDSRDLIVKTFANDADFRSLCRDHLACRDVIAGSLDPDDLRAQAYISLEKELAEECRLWLLVLKANQRNRES